MNLRTVSLLVAATICAVACTARTVSLMSFNIRNATGMDNRRDLDRTARVIKREKPETVAVLEVDSVTGRSGGRYILGELARRTGMDDYYAPAIDYDGGKYGIGILTKARPIAVHRMALPGREEKRALLMMEFPDYVFIATHLSLTEEDRMESARIIRQLVETMNEKGKPVFVAGDLNDHPGSPVINALGQGGAQLLDAAAHTFPADKPNETIDYIIMYPADKAGNALKSSRVVNEPAASDHRPIVAKVRIP